MEDEHTDPKRLLKNQNQDTSNDEEMEVFQYENENDDHSSQKHLGTKIRGRPPLGPKVLKLQNELQEALEINDHNTRIINTLEQQLEDHQNPDLAILHSTTREAQMTAKIQSLEQEIETQNATLKTKNEKIEELTLTTLKQGKRIITLITQNQKTKATNEELIDRLAKDALESRPATTTYETKPHILMMGDSNARRIEPKLNTNSKVQINLLQSGTLAKAAEQIQKQTNLPQWTQTRAVLVFLGTNDLQNGTRARDLFNITNQIAATTQQEGRKLIISQIPPFRDNMYLETEAKIYNRMIEDLPTTHSTISIVNYRQDIDDLPETETFEDHIHLDAEGPAAEILINKIKHHVSNMDLTFELNTHQQIRMTTPTRNPTTNYPTSQTQPMPYSKTFTVDMSKAGLVIGARQMGIAKLRKTYSVEVTYTSLPNTDPIFKISGQRESVWQAEKEIQRITSSAQPTTQRRAPMRQQVQSTQSECDCQNCKQQPLQCRAQPQQSTNSRSWAEQSAITWTPICKKLNYPQ